ncbi:MAG: alpha/beta hydrolase [Sedimentisphaerales bacterium]|jgi:acetyl esterase/lipase|nr:alpha/beta hydrolase [Sedimentisphaerales bacterium]HNY79876.1 alpha/beta hydrolase [Sedimentisphaerales bacterium]HOC64975.1 alpha/beta hydrolase [Sedimentisphaerales bacterium]HOH63316.1 alpha/beta hydrolase [Sedimentisphaerales bacterium]HPY51550.1 alpha/beta hydrolase [Sedimentisphaerales bacterium]
MKNLTLLMLGAVLALGAMAQGAEEKVVRLYDGPAPGSEAWKLPERQIKFGPAMTQVIVNVVQPTLTAFAPQAGTANGTGVVICPGGGFCMLCVDHEGYDVARYLTARGVTCFVLKYRLLQCETENPMLEASSGGNFLEKVAPIIKLALADGLAAMAHVRTHAKDYGVHPDRIGVMGFSAGGIVAASVAYNYTAETRPDFVAPIYLAHDLVIQGDGVRGDAPPLFVVAATDDHFGLAPQSVAIYQAWVAAKKPAELHLYAKGGHGFGMNKQDLPCDTWADRFADWLQMPGLLEK